MAKYFLSDRDVEFQRGINRAVKQLQPETVRPNSYHRAETGSAAAVPSYEYLGYFKLYLISETSGGTNIYKVRIADGATYQSETSVGGNSTARVNGTTFPIASYLSGALTSNTLFYLKFDSTASPKVTLESSTNLTLPSDTDTTAYYQLGRFYTGTTPYIQQDHTSVSVNSSDGVARWYWVRNEC